MFVFTLINLIPLPNITIQLVVFLFGCLLAIYLSIKLFKRFMATIKDRENISSWLGEGAHYYALRAETVRGKFNELVCSKVNIPANHTHPLSAADRSGASNFMDRLAKALGLKSYFVQKSRADERSGRLGSRTYYWAKDFTTQPDSYHPPDDALLCLVDVDQYMDMPGFLIDNFKPTILYTFQPGQVTRVSKEFSYTFDAQSVAEYRVNGGACYKHQVWNYGVDHLYLTKYWFWIPIKTVCYLVDRRGTNLEDHNLVLLTPVAFWNGAEAILSWFIYGQTLLRLVVAFGNFLRMDVQSERGLLRSTARVGCYAHALIDATLDDALAGMARSYKLELTLPQVQSHVGGDEIAAVPLLEYHRSKAGIKANVVYPVLRAIHRYQFGTFDPLAKPSLVPFMSPIVHECYAPDVSLGNEERCVKARITDVKSEVMMTKDMDKLIDEFINQLIPDGKHCPTDYQCVYDRQDRPSQRKILDEASYINLPIRIFKSFIKKEGYQEPKDPRCITTINGKDKAAYSRYMYPLADYLKTVKWYAFGRSPIAIAQHVSSLLAKANTATNSDFSRFDGRISPLLRELESRVLMRFFYDRFHSEVLDLHDAQYNGRGVMAPIVSQDKRVKYDTYTARCSGSPETSVFNSIINAFVAYVAIRKSHPEYDPQTAYDALGIYGGDDGLTADVDQRTYTNVATSVGLKLTAETVNRGSFGVKFLARVYGPDVWFGDFNSCCDLPRQLSKFHSSVPLPSRVKPVDKLLEKSRAYFLSDKSTPVIGQLTRKVQALSGLRFSNIPIVADANSIWNSELPSDVQYPNDVSGWATDYARRALPGFDFERFDNWLNGCNSLANILSPPLCMEPTTPKRAGVPVVVDGQVIPAEVAIVGKQVRSRRKRKVVGASPQASPKQTGGRKTGVPYKVSSKP